MTYKEALDMFCNNYCEENDGINDCINQCICREVLEEAVIKAEKFDAIKKAILNIEYQGVKS